MSRTTRTLLLAPLFWLPLVGCDSGERPSDNTRAIEALGGLEIDPESACFLTYLDCFDATEDAVACKLDYVACAYPDDPTPTPVEPDPSTEPTEPKPTEPDPTPAEPDPCMPLYEDCVADGGEPIDCKVLYNNCSANPGNSRAHGRSPTIDHGNAHGPVRRIARARSGLRQSLQAMLRRPCGSGSGATRSLAAVSI